MITTCSNRQCKRLYWRYRGDFPPRGYCSVPCYEGRRHRDDHSGESLKAVVASARLHRLTVHGSSDPEDWFDCEECARLDERYAVAAGVAIWR